MTNVKTTCLLINTAKPYAGFGFKLQLQVCLHRSGIEMEASVSKQNNANPACISIQLS